MASEAKKIAIDQKRNLILAIYDITDNKRRNKMVKCLEGYGIRVQKSAFEAMLSTKSYEAMKRTARNIIDPQEDSLRIYVLSGSAYVESWGKDVDLPDEVIII